MKRVWSRVLQAVMGIALGLSLTSLIAPAALATVPGGYSGYAAVNTTGGPWGGGYVQTQAVNLTDAYQGTDGYSYGNEELWVAGMGGSTSNYLEIGYTVNNPGCNFNSGLEFFTDQVYQGTQISTVCADTATVGTWYLLEIQQTGTDTWGAYLNNNLYHTYQGQPGNENTEVQVGLEYHLSDYLSFSGQANYSGMEVRAPGSETWNYWSSGTVVTPPVSNPPFTWQWTSEPTNGYNIQGV